MWGSFCKAYADKSCPLYPKKSGIFPLTGTASSTSLGTPTDVATFDPFNSFMGTLSEGGSQVNIVTSLNLTIANGLSGQWVIGSRGKAAKFVGRSDVKGSISVFFQDLVMYNKWLNGTPSSLKVHLDDSANRTTIVIPKIYYSGDTPTISGEGGVALNMPFQAVLDSNENTNIKLCRYVQPS